MIMIMVEHDNNIRYMYMYLCIYISWLIIIGWQCRHIPGLASIWLRTLWFMDLWLLLHYPWQSCLPQTWSIPTGQWWVTMLLASLVFQLYYEYQSCCHEPQALGHYFLLWYLLLSAIWGKRRCRDCQELKQIAFSYLQVFSSRIEF